MGLRAVETPSGEYPAGLDQQHGLVRVIKEMGAELVAEEPTPCHGASQAHRTGRSAVSHGDRFAGVDLFAEIADERRRTADVLASLTPEQMRTPSLCDAWTVRDVAAHLLMPLITPGPKFGVALISHRLNFSRTSEALTADVAQRSDADLVAGLRDNAASRFTPPGLGPQAPLTDVVIHGQDIRRPLGLGREFPPERLAVVLEFLTGPDARRGFVPAARTRGLRFVATDLDWSVGSGAEVIGPGEAVMMAVAGRAVALDDLTGAGVADLANRLAK